MFSQITLIPELELGIIVLTNQQESGAFIAITNQIKDSYLNVKTNDWVSKRVTFRKEAINAAAYIIDSIEHQLMLIEKASPANKSLDALVGTYRDNWFGDVIISVKNGKPWFTSKRSPKLCGELFYFRGNTFVVKWKDRSLDADAFVNFILDEYGKGTAIKMRAISPLTDFSYDFQDLDLQKVNVINTK